MKPFFDTTDLAIQPFEQVCSQSTSLEAFPWANAVESNALIYSGSRLRDALDADETALKAELHRSLSSGPGVIVIRQMYADTSVVDENTALFKTIIKEEQDRGYGQGDHFGNNERIWNSLQKVCLRDPALFLAYYGNPLLALVCRAWLGPFYQLTAQVNNVKPGGKAQAPHRDYHLGFQDLEDVHGFPAHIQMMSQYLTLQGAVAHTEMPIASGPTRILPFSHQFPAGYLAYSRPEFVTFFDAHCVQLPLEKGDAIFFSPALFHGAGTNTSSNDRMANLLQVSSAFGKTMESIDHHAMINAAYPHLLTQKQHGTLATRTLHDHVAALADGYAFPTNLDTDPPVGGHAPASMQHILHQALEENWPAEHLGTVLSAYAKRRRA